MYSSSFSSLKLGLYTCETKRAPGLDLAKFRSFTIAVRVSQAVIYNNELPCAAMVVRDDARGVFPSVLPAPDLGPSVPGILSIVPP